MTSPRRRVDCAPWKEDASIASRSEIRDGSGSYVTCTAAAPCRAASSLSASTQHTACPTNITSSGKRGSSPLTPASFTPGTSARVRTRATPGTLRAGETSTFSTRACACGDPTGQACSSPASRTPRSSVYSACPVTCSAALSCASG